MAVVRAHLMFSLFLQLGVVDKNFNPPPTSKIYIPGIVDDDGHEGSRPCI